MKMEIGIVKWFNNTKGFGFLCQTGKQEDIFIHYSIIQMEGYRTLKTGQEVWFSLEKSLKGYHASAVIPIGEMVPDDNKVCAMT